MEGERHMKRETWRKRCTGVKRHGGIEVQDEGEIEG